jgi:CspA family cold shock protein
MAQGTVKFFSAGKGYGFITSDAGGDDVFVQADGFKTLNEGDKVEYEAERGPKGMQATKVVKL